MKTPLTSLALACLVAAAPGVQVHAQSTPQQYLDRAADAVLALKSAQFSLRREGTPAVLDERTGLTFTAADCAYAAPDRVSCGVRVALKNGSILYITRVWVPDGVFQDNPLTKQFAKLPTDSNFNGVALFAKTGIPAILRTGVLKATIVNNAERVGGRETVHLTGEVSGRQLAPLMGSTLDPALTYPIDLWMEERTANPVRFGVMEPGGNGWLIELFGINEPVTIPTPRVPAAPAAQPGR